MTKGKSDLVEIACEVLHETEKAWLIFDGDRKVWIPKSIGEIEDGVATMPEWLAMEKELI